MADEGLQFRVVFCPQQIIGAIGGFLWGEGLGQEHFVPVFLVFRVGTFAFIIAGSIDYLVFSIDAQVVVGDNVLRDFVAFQAAGGNLGSSQALEQAAYFLYFFVKEQELRVFKRQVHGAQGVGIVKRIGLGMPYGECDVNGQFIQWEYIFYIVCFIVAAADVVEIADGENELAVVVRAVGKKCRGILNTINVFL